MQIYSIHCFEGKNIFSHKPVIKMVVNFGDLAEKTSRDIPGFSDRLVEAFPGLKQHHCSLGYEGGFMERLREGTYMPHITEHVILEMQNMLGYDVSYGKTRIIREPDLFYLVFEYKNERCGVECGRHAVDIIARLAGGQAVDIGAIADKIRCAAAEWELGPTTKAIYDEAVRRGIPVRRIGNGSLIQLGYGKYSRLIQASLSDAPSCIAVDIASNKQLTKQILMDYKIPVPCGDMAYTPEDAAALAEQIGYPVVIKPYDSNQGKGVSLDIRNEKQLKDAFNEAIQYSKAVLVEKYIKGKDYRILVVGDKAVAAAERRPPSVSGDGIHSIRELVSIENSSDMRGKDHEKPLTKIKLDTVALAMLEKQGLTLEYIPAAGEIVKLRDNGNLSTGGTARDCTEELHPYYEHLAVRAAKAIGLDIAGIDIIAEDISKPIGGGNGAVIEVNAAPGLRMHLHPSEGKPRNVAADILDNMFPAGQPSSIPIVSITGTNGKTTTTRLVRHVLTLAGKNVGMTSTSGVYAGDKCLLKGDNTGPVSARMILSNREVDAAVLETARGGIVRKGLGYDLADVGVITNISDDHLGLDGVHTLEDLAFAKALVVEAVKPDGYSVLNADDPMVGYLMERAAGNIILFSKEGITPMILKHLRQGKKAVYIHNGKVYIQERRRKTVLIDINSIPITFGGAVECNIENSLAAVSALLALGVSEDIMRIGLSTFKPDVDSNPGRFNVFEMGGFKVMLDYGHNAAGYNAVIKSARKMKARRLVGVVGVPGDRLDRSISEVGEICGREFDKLYIKEDMDLRGRKPGEVAEILYTSAVKAGIKKEAVKIILPELKALETAILDAQPGDMIIMLYEEFETAVELINKYRQELEESVVPNEMLVKNTVG